LTTTTVTDRSFSFSQGKKKLDDAVDKEGGSTQGSPEIVDIFDADRAAGNLNAVSTFPEKRLVKVYPIK
jgi:hypothetical protein